MCGSAPQTAQYAVKDDNSGKIVDRKIKVKDLNVINKWAKGAIARRKLTKLILTSTIANLKYPEYQNEKLVNTERRLFTDKELFLMLDYETGGKGLVWNNFYVDIGKNKKYQGQWNKQKNFEGLGTIVFSDGSKYQGQTKNGLFHGKGRMTHANGDIYQGEWNQGKANGIGVYVDQNGSMYSGDWQDDQYHGKGIETWNYGSIKYDGDFEKAKKTGKGRFEFDGNYYEGEFEDGQFEGQGKYYFSDTGKVYVGEFHENNIVGYGTMIWPDNTKYEGEFVNGKMEGKGTKTWPNGNRYEGMWRNDLQHGPGIFFSKKTGKETPEEWRDGKCWTWQKNPNQSEVLSKTNTSAINVWQNKVGQDKKTWVR